MAVPTRITDFNTTAASNSPSGTEAVGTSLDDYMRAYQAVVALDLASKGSDISSATTTDLGGTGGLFVDITGTTTITGFGTVRAGTPKIIKFEGALTLTHNATSLILPGGANITTADGDIALMISEGSGNWRCVVYTRAETPPPAETQIAAGWALVDVSGGNPSLTASHNVTSVTDNGVGDLTVTWATDFSSGNYAVAATVMGGGSVPLVVGVTNGGQAAGSVRLVCSDTAGDATDPAKWYVVAYGAQ